MGTPDRDARACEDRHDVRCDISTIRLTNGTLAMTSHDGLACAIVCAALNPEVIAEVAA